MQYLTIVDRSTVGKCLHLTRMVQKVGNWILYKLKERDIEKPSIVYEKIIRR